jgi:hypothetical protein
MTIPKVIFQTSYKPLPDYIPGLIEAQCPGWKYLHFLDADILKFFEDNPLEEFPDIAAKFNSFTGGPHKADIFRYYYLYINGGVFLDSDAMLEVPIAGLIDGYDFVSVDSSGTEGKDVLFNGFMATTKKHPFVYEALKHAYGVDDKDLVADYLLICRALFSIVKNGSPEGVKLYQALKWRGFRRGAFAIDDNKNVILIHHYKKGVVPPATWRWPRESYWIVFRSKTLMKLYDKVFN